MEILFIIIKDDLYIYEESVIQKDGVYPKEQTSKGKRPKLTLDCLLVHYLMKELKESEIFRCNFISNQTKFLKGRSLELVLQTTTRDLIDYNWNHRICQMVKERSELDHTFSWLSTLGGAYSALGDYFQECAETAAKISVNQFKLALRLGDPQIAARCRLYFALSLIQRKKFKLARSIIYNEFKQAQSSVVVDIRLLRMCKGIWAKLQYEHFLHVHHREEPNLKKIKFND
ncbi:uncharacterized protein F58A4.6 [Coccinella septempunctata]|uniref:uncharacterized protein F58A4.6 n=1 Tax=Coccinella septempunctata TaxID=41139 RepID=UPI001D068EF5|nr:uncharacterized protein F58A4.6 [Coccinella septempunctata]